METRFNTLEFEVDLPVILAGPRPKTLGSNEAFKPVDKKYRMNGKHSFWNNIRINAKRLEAAQPLPSKPADNMKHEKYHTVYPLVN